MSLDIEAVKIALENIKREFIHPQVTIFAEDILRGLNEKEPEIDNSSVYLLVNLCNHMITDGENTPGCEDIVKLRKATLNCFTGTSYYRKNFSDSK